MKSEASAGSQTLDDLKKEKRRIEIFIDFCNPNWCLVLENILGNIKVIKPKTDLDNNVDCLIG